MEVELYDLVAPAPPKPEKPKRPRAHRGNRCISISGRTFAKLKAFADSKNVAIIDVVEAAVRPIAYPEDP